jgi:hypothetical protein
MAPVYIPNWIYGVLQMQSLGQIIETTFSLRKDSGPTPNGTSLVQLATDWWNHHATELRACYTTGTNFMSVTLRDMSGASGAEGVYTLPPGTNGTTATGSLPLGSALVASLRSSTVGRSGRGRWYFGGLPGDKQVGNTMSGSYIVQLLSAAGLMASFSGNSTFATTACVASRTHAALYPIISVLADIFIDSQRRRLTGRGT